MSEQTQPINNLMNNLNKELTTLLREKDASDTIVNKLSNVFQNLEIYKELQKKVLELSKRNKELEIIISKHQKSEKVLSEKLNNTIMEKKGIEAQLENWRTHTAKIMTANVHVLNGLAKNQTSDNKPTAVNAGQKKIDSGGNITMEVKEEKKKGVHTLQDILEAKKKK